MTHEEVTFTRHTLTCDECKASTTFDGWDNRPSEWLAIQHPVWDLGGAHFCSKACASAFLVRWVENA